MRHGADAFTIGGFTFDPINASGVEGFDPVPPLVDAPPCWMGGGTPLGILELLRKPSTCSTPHRRRPGEHRHGQTVTDLFGLINSEFTVERHPGGRSRHPDLPAVRSVSDALNLGSGSKNIYTAIPGANGPRTRSPTS